MTHDLISKTTRNEFRELLVEYTLREIEMTFDVGGLTPRLDYQPAVSGQRRGLVEAYYANLDFSSPSDVRKLLTVYEEIIENLTRTAERWPSEHHTATINGLLRRVERDGLRYEGGRFVFGKQNVVVHTPSLVQLSEASIQEPLDKVRQKIGGGDSAGAIANSYTLVKEFLKQLLRKSKTTFNENESDIRSLYKLLAEPLHLAPRNNSLKSYLTVILEGPQRQIGGLFELANKASDRHARKYNHARLAVNTAITPCEFQMESYEYRQKREERQAS